MRSLPGWRFLCLGAASLIALAPAALRGQSVGGRAVDQTTNAPVAGVDVTLVDSAGVTLASARTGEDGTFTLRAGAPGTYRVRFQIPGYRMLVSGPLQLAARQDLPYSLELSPVPAEELDTLLVEGRSVPRHMAGFYRRRANAAWGNFLTRDDFMRWGPVEVTDVLRHTPQISVLPDAGSVTGYRLAGNAARRLGGVCPPLLVRDGVKLGTTDEWDVDLLFVVDGIEAVEVYGGGAGLPAEFWTMTSPCGVVAIWTRAPPVPPGMRPIHVIAQFGTRVAQGGLGAARLGAGLIVNLGRGFELEPAVNLLVPGLGAGDQPSGTQAVMAVRLRPFGAGSLWYVGTGGSYLSLTETGAAFTGTFPREGLSHVALSGVTLPIGGSAQPFAELHVLDPLRPSRVQWLVVVGMAFRLH